MMSPKKIPTIIGILLILSLVVGLSFLFESVSRTQTRGSASSEPKDVIVTNVSDTSFTVVWQTDVPTTGMLSINSLSKKKYISYDERDITGKLHTYITHSMTVRNVDPDMDYDVVLVSDGRRYPQDKKAYRVRTTKPITTQTPDFDPAYGTILSQNSTPAEGAIVFLTIAGGQTLSTIVAPSGTWVIPLNAVRTETLDTYIAKLDRVPETIIVKLGTSEIRAVSDTMNDSPVPPMTLGETYDFRNRDAKKPTGQTLADTSQQYMQSPPVGGAVLGEQMNGNRSGKIAITSPKDGATLASQLPLIQGIGLPGNRVTITVGILHPQVGTTIVGSDSLWRFTPQKPLTPGKQIVTMTTTGTRGEPIAVTHTFEVMKSGTQVLGDATPSGTLMPTVSITPLASTSPTLFTPTPTTTSSGTLLTPTPTQRADSEPMPTTGSYLPTLFLLILGIVLLFSGAIVSI